MKPQQLRTFVAVAEHRSIRAAARALHVSQPAVTRIVRELEQDLGVALVTRSVAGVALTDAGLAFHARASLLLEEMRRAREELLFMKEGGHAHVAAAMTSTVGMTLLPAALELFMQRMPQARVTISEDSSPVVALQKLQNGAFDFVIANTLPENLSAEFSQQPLFLMDWIVGARAAHPMSGASSLRELQDALWIVPSRTLAFFHDLFTMQQLDPPTRILECESFAIATHLLGRMDMLGLFSAALFDQELVSRGARALCLREAFPPAEVSIVTLRRSRLTPAAQGLIECLQALPLPAGMHRVRA
ncbi:LysR substrate-binding domain-containing protein [Pandoraea sp.]|uniref:LysR substrate-binding domain-containing protein n=1 Tax=Pandoraea sp. TaxID=1883445 RepID=UPI0012096D28|nr:LysR substrate-binding domain-containing protein [Pandoraea sp.]TAL53061.1 MAG: LysR family transcriptional regulator [Pandoraea sp.]TAM14787.1 MAG: LysR family transcriptional regulator [Pandoraea sp.]